MPKQSEFFEQMLQSAARVADMVFTIRLEQFRDAVEQRINQFEGDVRAAIGTINPEAAAKLQGMLNEAQGIRDAMGRTVEEFRSTYSLPSKETLNVIERDALKAIGLDVSGMA